MTEQDNNSNSDIGSNSDNNSNTNSANNTQKWFENNEVLYGWIIIFFPVAIYGFWQRKDYDQDTRWIYTVITAVVALSLLSVGSFTRYAVFFLAAPGYAWYIWSSDKVGKAHKMPLAVGAVLLVFSGLAELASQKDCPRMISSSNGCSVIYHCDGSSSGSC